MYKHGNNSDLKLKHIWFIFAKNKPKHKHVKTTGPCPVAKSLHLTHLFLQTKGLIHTGSYARRDANNRAKSHFDVWTLLLLQWNFHIPVCFASRVVPGVDKALMRTIISCERRGKNVRNCTYEVSDVGSVGGGDGGQFQHRDRRAEHAQRVVHLHVRAHQVTVVTHGNSAHAALRQVLHWNIENVFVYKWAVTRQRLLLRGFCLVVANFHAVLPKHQQERLVIDWHTPRRHVLSHKRHWVSVNHVCGAQAYTSLRSNEPHTIISQKESHSVPLDTLASSFFSGFLCFTCQWAILEECTHVDRSRRAVPSLRWAPRSWAGSPPPCGDAAPAPAGQGEGQVKVKVSCLWKRNSGIQVLCSLHRTFHSDHWVYRFPQNELGHWRPTQTTHLPGRELHLTLRLQTRRCQTLIYVVCSPCAIRDI